LKSQEARVALRHAFNRPKLNEIAWDGKGIDQWNPFDVTPYGIHEKLDANYDIALARKMLKAAGVAGQSLDINVLTGSPISSLEAQILVDDFQAAGLKASIVPQSATAWNAGLYTQRTNTGITNNYATLPFPYQQILLYLMSSTIAPEPPKYPQSPVPAVFTEYNNAFSQYKLGPYVAALKAAQRGFLAEVTVYDTFLAYLSEVVPNNLQGLDATTQGDVRFTDAYFS
jgi:ABC-type transport system substrate-binding protein